MGRPQSGPRESPRARAHPVTRLRTILALVALLSVGLVPSSTARAAVGDILTIVPVADAYVRADRPSSNYGSASRLQVDGSPVQQILLRFSVSGVGANTVASARLRLYDVDRSSRGGDVYHVANDTWGERTVTWATAPPADPTPLASLGPVATGTWYELDLTSLVSGDGVYSLKITSPSTDGADYTSREGSSGFGPRLVITIGPPADAVAPTVGITWPAEGETVSGTVSVAVDASDQVGVVETSLTLDGAPLGADAVAPYSFAWDTLTSANGTHVLQASARDAAGNVGSSDPVTLTLDNGLDTSPPSAPTELSASVVAGARVAITWTTSQDDRGVDHYAVVRDGVELATTPTASFVDPSVQPGGTYTYAVQAFDAAGNASPVSETVSITIPTGFTFAAAGDHGAGTNASASLAALDASGAAFYLALGDLDYNNTPTDEAWCDFVKAGLPTLGPSFPFELVSGNHEEQGGSDGYILNHAACLPDRLGSTPGVSNGYGAEYFFDHPAGAPLVRVIMIPPGLTIENVAYRYDAGDVHWTWLRATIRAARSSGIPWVVVGMHEDCLTVGEKGCSIGADLMNLLIDERVDLVLQGHDHMYERSKQLALSASCPAVPVGVYDADCVADDGGDGVYPKGAGTVFVIAGTFGRGLDPINPLDPEAPYFAVTGNSRWGFVAYSVQADRIDARFVPSSAGTFADTFSIVAGASADADRNAPSAPTDLVATVPNAGRIDLVWSASADDVGVTGYRIVRDGVQVGTSTTNGFSDTTVQPTTTYAYQVTALDAAGNPSPPSNLASVTTPGPGATLSFVPTDDAYVLAGSPTSNYGSSSTLRVDGSPFEHSLLKFTVSGIGSGTVASARLRLYVVNASNRGGDVFRVANTSWSESTVTWNTAPPADPVALASLGAVSINTWYEVDLTSLVTGDGTYSVRITSPSTDGADFGSAEGAAATVPRLVVTLA